jgi:hypothetical protein
VLVDPFLSLRGGPAGADEAISDREKPSVAKSLETLNIKGTMPTAEAAWTHLQGAIDGARLRGVRILKVVHGYGSSGVGGKIRRRVRGGVGKMVEAGKLKGMVFGEDWGPFSATARGWVDAFPALRNDSDYGKGNEGITLIQV